MIHMYYVDVLKNHSKYPCLHNFFFHLQIVCLSLSLHVLLIFLVVSNFFVSRHISGFDFFFSFFLFFFLIFIYLFYLFAVFEWFFSSYHPKFLFGFFIIIEIGSVYFAFGILSQNIPLKYSFLMSFLDLFVNIRCIFQILCILTLC